MRKPAFCICENKDADQLHSNCAVDQRLCFPFTDTFTKMKRLLQGCSSVAATMQQSNMYATTGGDKVAN